MNNKLHKLSKKSYYVYSICYRNKVIYIGNTNNIKRREYEHNRSYKFETAETLKQLINNKRKKIRNNKN